MLESAHRGYAYQDLLIATRLVDVLLGTITSAIVDKKLHSGDRFDDLTTINAGVVWERVQIKDRGTAAPLGISTFTSDQRGLKFDALLSSAITDRGGSLQGSGELRYRLVLGDSRPTDARLTNILRACERDPGAFAPGMATQRLAFKHEHIWPESGSVESDLGVPSEQFSFLRDGRFSRADVVWFCERLVVEVEAPRATMDLTNPGAAELVLIERVRRDIGAGSYPNEDRSPIDVAAALVRSVAAARAGRAQVTDDELLRRARLRHDFGAVARAYPVDTSREVSRQTTITDVARKAEQASDKPVPLLVVGPPGQGKSWACQRVQDALIQRGWLVAEHYCFLGDAYSDNESRAHADRVVGSLLSRLADADPGAVAAQRPLLSADDKALVDAIQRARERNPGRRVALLVDGLDHVTRILGSVAGRAGPSELLAQRLADLRLPAGCVIVVFTQPGGHLGPLLKRGADILDMPGLGSDQLVELAKRWGIEDSIIGLSGSNNFLPRREQSESSQFLIALASRSRGNALYATYLCREVLLRRTAVLDPTATLLSLPVFDGSLSSYYQHLCRDLSEAWIADVVALLDFGVSRAELREMRPEMGNRIDSALARLGPVLIERAMQGGIRVYHESFARYWLEVMANDPVSMCARLNQIASWLEAKGLFHDSRAFRFLFTILARAERFEEVVGFVGRDFVGRAVAAGFHASAIRAALAVAATCAAHINDWVAIVRCIELSRAASSYEDERLESTLVAYADVVMAVLGSQVFAERLLFDGRTTIGARPGVKVCAQIDAVGETAPWQEYLDAFDREAREDSTSYDADANTEVRLALLRGRLRVAVLKEKPERTNQVEYRQKLLKWLSDSLERASLPARGVVAVVCDTLGIADAEKLITLLTVQKAAFSLALAQRMGESGTDTDRERALEWASSCVNNEACAGEAHNLIKLGVAVEAFEPIDSVVARQHLLDLTQQILQEDVQFEPSPLYEWLDACVIAARRSPVALAAAEAMLEGEGWYRCWLRFAIGLCRAEVLPLTEQAQGAADALSLLAVDVRPFVGTPRACDLYRIQPLISSTLERALALQDDASWIASITLLSRVSDDISTTLHGEMGGPLSRDALLDLVLKGATAKRYEAASETILRSLKDNVGGAFYSDIAGFYLSAARLALIANDRSSAVEHWQAGSKLLTAYGWRRDVTIYELLDSLPALIQIDRSRARECLQVLQPLCERVLYHTDGKDTHGVRSRWWQLLASADPMSLAKLVAPELLRTCNLPYGELERARTELWLKQHQVADPFVAAALRLTIEGGLERTDPFALRRLRELSSKDSGVDARFLCLLASRADERPTRYSYSNSAEMVQADDSLVAEINAAFSSENVPRIYAPPDRRNVEADRYPPQGDDRPATDTSLIERLEARHSDGFDNGMPGLAMAINTWRRRPHGVDSEQWSVGRFANVIGYRLLECLQEGAAVEAELGIRALAGASRLDTEHLLLSEIAKGLERNGFIPEAVLAYTLSWTNSRAHGGWFNFGGETNIDSLRQAARLDSTYTLTLLSVEVERVVRGSSYGTLGVSQALIIGLAGADWSGIKWPHGQSSTQVAFAAWDHAAEVIADRLPRLHPNDDPDWPYEPSEEWADEKNAVERAMVMGAFAGLSHPSREQKRRALLAIQLLASRRPLLAAEGLNFSLAHLTEPATLSWLLAVFDSVENDRAALLGQSIARLRRLCASVHLTVRALARRLLIAICAEPGDLPIFDAIDELASSPGAPIWTPDRTRATDDDEGVRGRDTTQAMETGIAERAESLMRGVASSRLRDAVEILPGFRKAVGAELTRVLGSEEQRERAKKQLQVLASRAEFRWPDAFVAPYEAAEEVLQRVAGGGRLARARAGEVISDPVEWEEELAGALLNDPQVPLAFEASRMPRPNLPPPPGYGDALWNQLIVGGQIGTTAEGGCVSATDNGDGEHIARTIRLAAAGSTPTIDNGVFAGWRVIGIWEARWTSPDSSWPGKRAVRVLRSGAVESRVQSDERGFEAPPFAAAEAEVWCGQSGAARGTPVPWRGTGPLVALLREATRDGFKGLGYACTPLAPTDLLVESLRLNAGDYLFDLHCSRGALGMVVRSWRSSYVVSDYELAWPTLCGNMLLVRPDLFAKMVELFPDMKWREYIDGVPACEVSG